MLQKASLQKQIIILFLFALIIPVLILSILSSVASYSIITREMDRHNESVLSMMVGSIELYQEDLQRLTIIPYLHDDVFYAIKLKANGQYESSDDYTKLLADRALSTILPRYLRVTRDDVLGFSIYMKSGDTYTISKTTIQETAATPFSTSTETVTSSWIQAVLAADGRAVLLGNREQARELYGEQSELVSVARMIKDPDSQEFLGIIVADADTRVLDRSVKNLDFDVSFKACIMDRWGATVYTHGFEPDEITQVGIPIEGYRMSSTGVGNSGWNIYVYLSESELLRRTIWIFLFGILLVLSGLVVAIILYHRLNQSVVHPVHDLLATMKEVEKGNLQIRVTHEEKTVHDIVIIGDRLNQMIQSLDFHIKQEYISRMKQQEAEYQSLQSQIKPHFLLNTLNGFLELNRFGETSLLEESIQSLAMMLRYIQQRQTMTTIGEEFRFIESYCQLQQMRFSDRMIYSIEIDDQVREVQIPRLMIQPLVENAVIHGMEPVNRPCTIVITAKHQLDENGNPVVLIVVRDDGAGFNVENIDLHTSIGLGNCLARLQLAFPEATYEIQSEAGKGAMIKMTGIPLQGDDDEYCAR